MWRAQEERTERRKEIADKEYIVVNGIACSGWRLVIVLNLYTPRSAICVDLQLNSHPAYQFWSMHMREI